MEDEPIQLFFARQILSVKLDDWTEEEVEALEELGGNTVVNMKYEAFVPECKKPKPDSSVEERSDFIRYD